MSEQPLLSIRDLSIAVDLPDGRSMPIIDDLSFDLRAGETLGIVGESGSGKSLASLAVIGLLPRVARPAGQILLDGEDLLSASEDRLCKVRGNRIGMIFQEPLTALNPAMTIGDQIAEGLVWHRGLSWRQARREAVVLLDQVRIPDAKRRAGTYPHEMSGGQRQRVGIAIALALKPALMIADEPTTALDVTVQAEVLDILDDLVREYRMALILVSHDLGVIARMCDRTLVLYAGRRMEEGPTRDVLTAPLNPYTRGLLSAVPKRVPGKDGEQGRLVTIPGTVPGFAQLPEGCCFSDRCPDVMTECRLTAPGWSRQGEDRRVRCLRAEQGEIRG
ncbi:ATP-binding cassette domain-containing protein [Agrobacterium vitis]|uniref:ABC transporter ATP-binding protein n=1 Tax=Rhizobium/Agrobacterium group TaxID=227290 RepID=UPI0008DBEB47|nr:MULTISPECIES: ABC transporter ATP-binding protein [Rhizobium/Agrobacterium group]MCF1432952.1 ABC transporter ATP-binding protein [Allorhizobium ampelinum]MUO89698.1 ATP-binding cassette domain-containing protein [Agrobacterium vitis]MUZ51360.1 ATP-binding cassette domain-containing protein [Agrobacterium vitis]MUZ92490.1 ATP-binding cassette domain-containing protein [Agrobacterium vitis]MVA38259.1 ATP-binding cassette domain-containing protein [Agrobacterium vitis]